MKNTYDITELYSCTLKQLREIDAKTKLFITGSTTDKRTAKLAKDVTELVPDITTILADDFDKSCSILTDTSSLLIGIDVSLISRKKLAQLFSEFCSVADKIEVELVIFYCLAKYIPPSNHSLPPNEKVTSVHSRFSGWSTSPGLKVLSVVGLGYEKDKAIGAVEYIESSRSIVLIPSSSEEEYQADVKKQNALLLEMTNDKDKIEYNVEEPINTIYILDSVLAACIGEYKPVLFPFGPKIMYVCALISAIVHPYASVWYVSGEEEIKKSDLKVAKTFGFHCKIINKESIIV